MLDNEYSDYERDKLLGELMKTQQHWYDILLDGRVHKTHHFVPSYVKEPNHWVGIIVENKGDFFEPRPVCAKTGKSASWSDTSTWCSFAEASKAVQDGKVHQIAFVRKPGDGLTAVNIFDGMNFDVEVPEAYLEVDYLARGYTSIFRSDEIEFTLPEPDSRGPEYCIDRDWYVIMTGRMMKITTPGFVKAQAPAGNPFQNEWWHRFP